MKRYGLPMLACALTLLTASLEKGNGEGLKIDGFDGTPFAEGELINQKMDGYRGIWYMNTPLDNEYKYKYSGGMAVYPWQHRPFAIYSKEANKTFFNYGGTDSENSTLLHMVSYFDHSTGEVPKPTLVMDKKTKDAHDNPVISMDEEGYIYVFSTSHGRARPSFISKSTEPYDIRAFERVDATRLDAGNPVSLDNFSYMQAWYLPETGFASFFTRYGDPAGRTIMFMSSQNGEEWSEWQRIAAIKQGHYQVSAIGDGVAGTAFDFHPNETDQKGRAGLNWRTNLYYVETRSLGQSWQTADGKEVELPLTEIDNPALIHDYYSEGLVVYIKDIIYDRENRPVIIYTTSKGYESGPENDPRIWYTARWGGNEWHINPITQSDNNYDHGSLYIEEDSTWRFVAPVETGPQAFNPGGEVVMLESRDQGKTWERIKELTRQSRHNHTFVRRPVNAHPEFYAIWADGHGRQPSESTLYFADRDGNVFKLPEQMKDERVKPTLFVQE